MNPALTLQAAEPGTDKFSAAINIITGSTGSPVFKISSTGYTRIRLVLPVLEQQINSGTETDALVDEKTWEHLSVKIKDAPTDRIEFEKKEGLPRAIELSVINPELPVTAAFILTNFKVLDSVGSSVCYLQYWDDPTSEWVDEPSTPITIRKIKEIIIPVITVFKADRDLISAGDPITLSWTTEKCHHCQLLVNEEAEPSDKNLPPAGNAGKNIQQGISKYSYTLIAYADKEETTHVTQTITISVEGASVSRFAGPILAGSTAVTGIYPYGDKLYAIVLDKERGKAFLYASENGIKQWEQVFAKTPDQPVELDVRLAGSPGVVFDKKLFLIGGSSVNPDQPGNDIGCYDFKEKTWVSSAGKPKENFPTPRMGHSCIVSAGGDEIWLMGGYHPAKGTLNDMWSTKDGKVWTEQKTGNKPITLPEGKGRCMMGVALHEGEIWLYGGYSSVPGGQSYDHTYTYKWSKKEKNWEKIKWAIEVSGFSNEYQALSLASVKNTLFLFQTSLEGTWENFIYRLYESNGWKAQRLGGITNEWSLNQDGYSLQTTVYKSAVWIRSIEQASSAVTGIKGSGLYYFYYVPKPQKPQR